MSYTVQDGLTLARKLGKGVPFTGIDVEICDMVSSGMYRYWPWRDTLRVFTPVVLIDSVQDLDTGLADIFRITQCWITRTDVSPNQTNDINVSKSLTIDLNPVSPWQVRAAAYQAGINQFRLEKAVRVPTGSTFQLGGEYQPQHTKISDVKDPLWFTDQFLEIYAKGLIYWAMYLADDARAGTAQKVGDGAVTYTGQLAIFMDAVDAMANAEDFGNIDGYYPSDSMGAVDGRRWYSNDLFPFLIS